MSTALIEQTQDLATDDMFMQFVADATCVLDDMAGGGVPAAKQALRLAKKIYGDVHLDLEQRIEALEVHVDKLEEMLEQNGYRADWESVPVGYVIYDTEV